MRLRFRHIVLALLVPAGLGLLLSLVMTTSADSPAAAHAAPQPAAQRYVPGELIIRLRPHVSKRETAALLAHDGLVTLDELTPLGYLRVRVPAGRQDSVIRRLEADSRVTFVGRNHLLRIADTIPDDTYYYYQWGLSRIQAPAAWDVTTGTAEFTVAILDTGVDIDHPDIKPKLVSGKTFVTGTTSPDDDHGHGTMMAGIAAATSNNHRGVAGVSWEARIMPIKVLSAGGYGTEWDVSQGVIWAVSHGADVLNMSLAGEDDVQVLHDAVDYASAAGALVVAAAGNCGDPTTWSANGCSSYNPVLYPAAYDRVLAVAATTEADSRASFSEFQPYVDVAAPGVHIYSTLAGGSYAYVSGTSPATAFVSGLAALVWSSVPDATNDEVRAVIESSADDVNSSTSPSRDVYLGWGRINANRAVRKAIGLDLHVSKSDGQTIVRQGDRLTYTVHFTNSGAITATNVEITDTLPTGVQYVEGNPRFTTLGGSRWQLDWGDLAPGSSSAVTISVWVPATTTPGTLLTNTVQIGANGSDGAAPPPSNNQAWDVDRVVGPVLSVMPHSILFLSDTATGPQAATVVVSNVGSDTLHWETSPSADWLVVSPTSGIAWSNTPAVLTTSVRTDRITQTGYYTATLMVSATPSTVSGAPQAVGAKLVYVDHLSHMFLPLVFAGGP